MAIDPRRGRAHILNDVNWPDYIARVYSFTFAGRRLSRPIVDKGKFMASSAIAVHPTNGRVFAATTLWPRGAPPHHGTQRLNELRRGTSLGLIP
ncbi:hypothetical protein [Nocardioides astragali]|uniref:Uncharacterized protein n=1 Tax=Nocardioides astragali TaxID=1776736 RepID=A0ABW2N2S7_9ACTN|nr:hypothetical protein [Nocardioides astragali]